MNRDIPRRSNLIPQGSDNTEDGTSDLPTANPNEVLDTPSQQIKRKAMNLPSPDLRPDSMEQQHKDHFFIIQQLQLMSGNRKRSPNDVTYAVPGELTRAP